MASVSKEGNLIKVRWDRDDWLKGLLPEASQGGTDSREGSGFSAQKAVNPWRDIGYIQPGYNGVADSGMGNITTDAIIKNIAVSGSSAYPIEDNVNVHKMNAVTGSIQNASGFPHAIGTSLSGHGGHADFVGSDIITYTISGTDYVFYSWNDGTDGDVGRLSLPNTFADDYMSASATGGAVLDDSFPHPMIVGDDDILYIANGSEIVAYDGPNNTAATLAFSVPNGYTITSFAKSPNYLVVFCSTKTAYDSAPGEAFAYFWDYASEDATFKYDLNAAYVNGGFSYKGTTGCFVQRTSQSSNRSFMLVFTGGGFETVASFRQKIPGHGGVAIMDEMVIFNAGFFDEGTSSIYAYGRLLKGFDNALNQIGLLDGTGVEGCAYATGYDSLFASAGGTDAELQKFISNYQDGASFYTGLANIDFGRYGQGKVVGVKVVYKDTVSAGREFTLSLNTDSSGVTTNTRGTQTTLLSNVTATDTLIEHIDFASDGTELPQFSNSIGIYADWADGDADEAHIIHSVEVFIEPVSTSS